MAERESIPRLVLAVCLLAGLLGAVVYGVMRVDGSGARYRITDRDLANGEAFIRRKYTSGQSTVGAVTLARAGPCLMTGSADIVTAGASRRSACAVSVTSANGDLSGSCR